MIIQNISVALSASTLNFCWEKKRRKPSREALKSDVTIKGSVSQFASDQPVKKAANDLDFFLQVFTPSDEFLLSGSQEGHENSHCSSF